MPSRAMPFDPIEVFLEDWEASDRSAGLAMATVAAITRAQRVLLTSNELTLREFGLTFARYEALAVLASRAGGPVSMSRMSEWLMVHPTSVTNTVDRLEEQGLIRRMPHPTDRRALMLELTPAGRDLTQQVMEALADQNFSVRGVSEAEMKTLVKLLRRIRQAGGEFEEVTASSARRYEAAAKP